MFDGQFMQGDTLYAKEMRRWNTPQRDGGTRPDSFQEFPKMVYKARKPSGGGPPIVIDPRDENFSNSNCLIVGNASEERDKLSNGWRSTPDEAVAYAKALEDEISFAAAARQQADKRLGEKAREEARLVDASTDEHVPEVTPQAVAEVKKRRGRPPKNAA